MDTSKCELIYSQIANMLNEIIPVEWSKILLYAEVEPGVVDIYYCFYERDCGTLVQYEEIKKKYKVDDTALSLKQLKLAKIVYSLNNEFSKINKNRWTSMTFILEYSGKFHIDFGYENLSDSNNLDRRKQWKKKYLV